MVIGVTDAEMVMRGDELVVIVGEGVKGEGVGVIDELLSKVEDELLNVAFG